MTGKCTQNATPSFAAIIVAAGKGLRAAARQAGDTPPKQYQKINGISIISQSINPFISCDNINNIVVVISPDDQDLFQQEGFDDNRITLAHGGKTRQESVFLGLKKLNEINSLYDFVLIQDAARPFLAEGLLSRIMATVEKYGSALPVVPLADTLKQLSHDGIVEATPDRGRLFAAQTPQAFAFKDILEAHRKAALDPSLSFTDDASIAEWAGMSVHTVEGDPRNFKITTPDDFARAETYIAKGKKMETRIGQGFDVHRFAAGDHVILGGVKIPHDMALSGHSDADVLLHAITDALYGSIADGDIGAHFPPSDPKWKGADSTVFLDDAVTRVRNRGGEIVFLDATILCETPKIGPHRDTIRTRIAEITGLPTGRIAVKATTTEQLGFTGRREGIAAMALATIRLPSEN